MAIIVKDLDAIFYEIPKTGTSWLRSALTKFRLPFEEVQPIRGVWKRHALPEHYPEKPRLEFAIVRHPLTWYQSWYRAHYRSGRTRPPSKQWCLHRFLGTDIDAGFSEWLSTLLHEQPAFLTRVYEAYCGPFWYERLERVLRQENLSEDLQRLLHERFGYRVTQFDPPRENVSPDVDAEYTDELRQRVLAHERVIIERWYSEER